MYFQNFWDFCAQDKASKASEISKNALSGILGLLFAEQRVRNLKQKTDVQKTSEISTKLYFQQLWDSCAQNKTSEISKNALSGILGLLCAEQNVGNLNKTALSGIMGLLCAEQGVGNLNKCTFRNSWAPVR